MIIFILGMFAGIILFCVGECIYDRYRKYRWLAKRKEDVKRHEFNELYKEQYGIDRMYNNEDIHDRPTLIVNGDKL